MIDQQRLTHSNITILLIMLVGYLFNPNIVRAQREVWSEAPIIFKAGVRYSTHITVHFSEHVLDLAVGTRYTDITSISSSHLQLKGYLSQLESRYGDVILVKTILNARWGDVSRTNRTTGEQVIIKDMSQLFVLKFAALVPLDSLIAELNDRPEVEYTHGPIQTIDLATPNDEYYEDDQWNLPKIDAEDAWDITQGSSSVVVGVIGKSGVNRNHEDLVDKDVNNLGDTAYSGYHDTQVAGIIAAETDNSDGIASLGWNIKYIPYKYTAGNYNSLVDKIEDAVDDGCEILNFSFHTTDAWIPGDCPPPGRCPYTRSKSYQSVSDAIANALSVGVIVVASAGNTDPNLLAPCGPEECGSYPPFPTDYYPAAYSGVIAVSATNASDSFAGGLSYNSGDFIDVAAPGMGIKSTYSGTSGYFTESGTSFASPHVAALAGLIRSIYSVASVQTVTNIITSTAEDLLSTGKDDSTGWGRINAYDAVDLADDLYGVAPATPGSFNIQSYQTGGTYRPKLTWSANSEQDLVGYKIERKLNSGSWGTPGLPPYGAVGPGVTSYIDYEPVIWASGNNKTAYYRMRAYDDENRYSGYTSEKSIAYKMLLKGTLDKISENSVPKKYRLGNAFPNPFNPVTTLQIDLPEDSRVTLTIYNLAGHVVRKWDCQQAAGYRQLVWNGTDKGGRQAPSGIYIYRLVATSTESGVRFVSSKKMVLLK